MGRLSTNSELTPVGPEPNDGPSSTVWIASDSSRRTHGQFRSMYETIHAVIGECNFVLTVSEGHDLPVAPLSRFCEPPPQSFTASPLV